MEKFYSSLKSQGFAISKDTVHQLLYYLEDCFLVRTVWMESSSEKQRMVNPRKSYPLDPALIPLFDRSGKSNIGHALETVVFSELERRGFAITYVRTPEGYEVDFLARDYAGAAWLIQVCSDASDNQVLSREIRALDSAGRLYPDAEKILLILTRDRIPGDIPEGIIVRPAWEWLLAGKSTA